MSRTSRLLVLAPFHAQGDRKKNILLMIKNDFSTFLNSYNQAEPTVKAIVDSSDIPVFVDKLVEKHPNWSSYRNDLVNMIVDVVLETTSLRVILESLRTDNEVSTIYSADLVAEIEKFVHEIRKQKGLVVEEEVSNTDVSISEEHKNEVPQRGPGDIPESTANEPESIPISAEKPTVKPLRTFADDVQISRAHGYGAFRSPSNSGDDQEPAHRSNQDDVLRS